MVKINFEIISRILWYYDSSNRFCEMSIDGRNIFFNDSFIKVTNIRNNVQNNSLGFDGLLNEMVYKEQFVNQ